ncbi:hypothetical protein DRQ09_00705 [candidate division KSB1 bacterium]|nr:MAG: hypothetical protein DRQ09_00705 [candidate division KSB1 bacterium]
MKIKKIKEILNAELLTDDINTDVEIQAVNCADLMSDVLAFQNKGGLLITGLINIQVLRTAAITDIVAIVFVRGKIPDKAVIDEAKSKNILLLCTKLPMYEACGLLYKEGLKGISE